MKIQNIFMCALLGLLFAQGAKAVPLINGSFDSADGWVDASVSGSASIAGGSATLSTAAGSADLYSSVLVQGDDGFFTFSDALTLADDVLAFEFDVRFRHLADLTEGTFSSFEDSLSVNFYDSLDFSFDQFFSSGPGLDFAESDTWVRVSLDISALAGRDIAVSFELNDYANGLDTFVELDNLAFVFDGVVSVSEPNNLWLMFLGLFLLALRYRNRMSS